MCAQVAHVDGMAAALQQQQVIEGLRQATHPSIQGFSSTYTGHDKKAAVASGALQQ